MNCGFFWIISQDKSEEFSKCFNFLSKWSLCFVDWLIDRRCGRFKLIHFHCALEKCQMSNFFAMISSIMFTLLMCGLLATRPGERRFFVMIQYCRKFVFLSLIFSTLKTFQGDTELFFMHKTILGWVKDSFMHKTILGWVKDLNVEKNYRNFEMWYICRPCRMTQCQPVNTFAQVKIKWIFNMGNPKRKGEQRQQSYELANKLQKLFFFFHFQNLTEILEYTRIYVIQTLNESLISSNSTNK